jgi:hypothetical protein
LLPHLLNLHALRLDLLLLLLHLSLSLSVSVLCILHRVADYIAGAAAEQTADRSTRKRMAHCRANERATTRTERCAAESAFFTRRERLPRASGENESSCQRETCNHPKSFAHKKISFIQSGLQPP